MKHTIEFIRSEFEKEGYQLLSTEYIGAHDKLDCICPVGHKIKITWHSFRKGHRCPECFGTKRYDIDFVRQEFEKEGYKLLTKGYKNNKQKIEYICSNGHRNETTFHAWLLGTRCPDCYNLVRGESQKFDIEYIRDAFKKEGYQLLTKKYIGCKQKLNYICPNGHRNSMIWGSFQQGHRCPDCYNNTRKGFTKMVTESIREEFNKEGYTLLTKEYRNTKQKLRYICPNGHERTITYDSWRAGSRCKLCVNKNVRHTIEYVRAGFEEAGYILLTKEYKNCSQKLEYICTEGHTNSMSWNAWRKGARCPDCYNLVRQYAGRLTIDFVKQEFENEGYTLLSTEYSGAHDKLKVLCPEGHEIELRYYSFKQGNRCPICFNEVRGASQRLNIDFIKQEFNKDGYQLLTKVYKNNTTKLKYICPKGHYGNITWNAWKSGCRCNKCCIVHSKAENEIFEFVKAYFPDAIQGDRTIISPFELDIVISSKLYAIEYCGLFWHSESQRKDKRYHLNKLELCNNKGYNLITIFEDEWLHKRNIVESRLKAILDVQDAVRIYARKCTIKEVSATVKNEFLNKYHIQGADSSSIKLGAYYNNELVSIMTFSKPSLSKGYKNYVEGTYELSRFCSHPEYTVLGIAGKLLKYFTRNYNYTEIYSYSDRRWSIGNLYNKLGFTFIHSTSPNYWYVVGDTRKHRFLFRKSELYKKLEVFDPELSESQNMANAGINRIFDCGNHKWSYT